MVIYKVTCEQTFVSTMLQVLAGEQFQNPASDMVWRVSDVSGNGRTGDPSEFPGVFNHLPDEYLGSYQLA